MAAETFLHLGSHRVMIVTKMKSHLQQKKSGPEELIRMVGELITSVWFLSSRNDVNILN